MSPYTERELFSFKFLSGFFVAKFTPAAPAFPAAVDANNSQTRTMDAG